MVSDLSPKPQAHTHKAHTHKTTGVSVEEFPCASCGSVLAYQPGQDALACDYCGFKNSIEQDQGEDLKENDLWAAMRQSAEQHEMQTLSGLSCQACAAEFSAQSELSTQTCPFCGTAIVIEPHEIRQLKPDGVLPFSIDRAQAQAAAKKWRKSLFFAPRKFKEFGRDDAGLKGMYIPFWTCDAQTRSDYSGQRGDTHTYTTGSGKNRRTRRVTHWRSVSGHIRHFFDDILIWAGRSLPEPIIKRFRSWRLDDVVPYDNQYLVGIETQAYDLPLKEAHEQAKARMRESIRDLVRKDIGGDKQRIETLNIN